MDGEQNPDRSTFLEPNGGITHGSPTDAFGVEQRDPGQPYELTDEFGQQIDAEIQEQLAPLYGDEEYEPDEVDLGDAVSESIGETTIGPDQQAAVVNLVQQRPEIGSEVASEALTDPLEEISEEYGLQAAADPEVIAEVYDQLDAMSGGQLTAQAEEERIKSGIMSHARIDPATGRPRDIFS